MRAMMFVVWYVAFVASGLCYYTVGTSIESRFTSPQTNVFIQINIKKTLTTPYLSSSFNLSTSLSLK